MPIGEQRAGGGDLLRTALDAPAEDLGGGVGELVEQWDAVSVPVNAMLAAQHEVGQVHDALVAQEPRDLEAGVVGVVLERGVASPSISARNASARVP